MVVALGPGKFYGSSLPRPRYYTDVKLNDERVDPPTSVLDPLLSWANEAHWSMGGLSFNRLKLQGRIEGNINKLRIEREKIAKKKRKAEEQESSALKVSAPPVREANDVRRLGKSKSVSPPPAPIATKRRRLVVALFDDEDDYGEQKEEVPVVKRRLVKKLGDDFDRVAAESKRNQLRASRDSRSEINGIGDSVMQIVEEINEANTKGEKTNSERKGKTNGKAESGSVSGTRTSPRLAKRRSN